MTYYIDEEYGSYRGTHGWLLINFTATIDHPEPGHVADYLYHPLTQEQYREVGFELLDDRHGGDYLPHAHDNTPDGKGVLYHLGGDGPTVRLHPDGVTFDPNKHIYLTRKGS